ncbi:hypothetical protein [Myxosarcina sp. GI1]|uniref:hypothetical protein n=1 Tax=Myxosarcina sp. GI1 TaxID=1541065 RepID=UPI00056B8CA2|nr:hypothetical protein [Myxosarcina sp. GI1]
MSQLSTSSRQILSLSDRRDRLYGEVIQAIPPKQVYWFRPLFLVEDVCNQTSSLDCNLIDLRQSSDLILPQNWFDRRLDTEIIPLLAKLYSHNCSPAESISHNYLYSFVRSLWQTNREAFDYE